MKYADERTAAFRKTLDRLPDEIALAIGLHVYDKETLDYGQSCVCGWIVREAIARETGRDPEEVHTDRPRFDIVDRFGGTFDDWDQIFTGVCEPDRAALIEEALFDRVMAAATASTRKARRSALRQGER